ncbi:hypothetical protein ABC345_16840 [Shouchella sp. 1P09AA]|uniref:hypothetical protein n=1 Tax=unclassified Shouchella TaxID=2893065 RepID=UPI0039A2F230
MLIFQLIVLLGIAYLIYLSQKKKLKGDRKMSILFFTILGIGLIYGSAYLLQIEIPSFANGLTRLVKAIQGIQT